MKAPRQHGTRGADHGPSAGIHIFGASGSGTTTLGRALAARLEAKFLDADDYYWLPTDPPYTQKRAPAARVRGILRDIEGTTSWVLSGSLCGWGDELTCRFSLAVFLHLDPELRMARLKAREQAQFGDRIEPGGDMYATHRAFLDWAAAYDEADMTMRSRALHEAWIKTLSCPVVKLDSATPPDELLVSVCAALARNNDGRHG